MVEALLKNKSRFRALILCKHANLETSWLRTLEELPGLPVVRTIKDFRKHERVVFLLPHTQAWPQRKELRKEVYDLVVVDESQKLKSRGSQLSHVARSLVAKRRVALSATPFDSLTKNPQELWSHFVFLVPHLFGTRYADFEKAFCYKTGYNLYQTRFKPANLERALEMVAPYTLRIETNEVFPLEEPVFHEELVNMPQTARQIFDKLERDMVAEMRQHSVTVDFQIVLINKLDQICGGFVKTDEGHELQVGTLKIERLKRILERIELPVIIFARYLWEVDRIAGVLGRTYRVLTLTGRNKKERTQIQDTFQAGGADVIVCQQTSGGEAIDLNRAHQVVFYGFDRSSIYWDQAIGRARRGLQKKQVHVWVLLARNSTDETKYRSVRSKVNATRAILARYRLRARRT